MTRKLQILRIDNDLVQKMDLQIGDNNISRSVVAGCKDSGTIKHAVTINLTPDNEMTITPYQISPCYMKSVESPRWQLLKLGSTVPIKPGDICSLVPDKCWFKVILVSDKMETNQEHVLKRKANDAIDYNMSGKKSYSDVGEGDSLETTCHIVNEMLNNNNDTYVFNTNSEDAESKDDKDASSCKDCKDTTSVPVQKSEEICGASSRDKVKEGDSSGVLVSEAQNTNQSPKKEDDVHKSPNANNTDTQAPTNETNTSITTAANVPRRERCKYGDKCYRKNPQHKTEFSHPGDTDYDIPDNRKECPYGLRCYRKNPHHKMQYKHTGSNIRNERTKRRQKRTPTTVSTDTLSDLEDSSEEESVDESEYEPFSDEDSLEDDEMYPDENGSEGDVVD